MMLLFNYLCTPNTSASYTFYMFICANYIFRGVFNFSCSLLLPLLSMPLICNNKKMIRCFFPLLHIVVKCLLLVVPYILKILKWLHLDFFIGFLDIIQRIKSKSKEGRKKKRIQILRILGACCDGKLQTYTINEYISICIMFLMCVWLLVFGSFSALTYAFRDTTSCSKEFYYS